MFEHATVPRLVIDGRDWRQREVSYAPEELRKHRPYLYVLTDKPDWVQPAFAQLTNGVLESVDEFSESRIAESAFYIYFSLAQLALAPLRRIVSCGGLFAPPPLFGKQPFHLVSEYALRSYNLAGDALGHEPFMGLEVHSQLCQAVELTRDIAGDFVEVGVFSGSSALTSLFHMTSIGVRRRCWLLDTYSGFSYSAALSSPDIIWAGSHLQDPDKTIERIEMLTSYTGQAVQLAPTNICSDPLPSEIKSVALANLDVDLYEAVFAGLTKLAPLMALRGVIVVEDPTSVPGLYGAYLALDEFMRSPSGTDFICVRVSTQYFLIKVS